jgi:Ca-activated chloride channel family protein
MSRSYQILPFTAVLFTCVFWAACDAPERTVTTRDTVRERLGTKDAYRQEAQSENTGARQLAAVQKGAPKKKDEKRRNLALQAELEDATQDTKQESSSASPASPAEHDERDVRVQSGPDAVDSLTEENLVASTPPMKEQTVQAVQSTARPLARSELKGKTPSPDTPQPTLSADHLRPPSEPVNRENYAHFDNNPVLRVAEKPVSTFSIDVDTGAYANVRRFLRSGTLPVRDAVRVEELINYFSYHYPPSEDASTPFRLTTEIAPTPWNPKTHLLHIGIKGYEVPAEELPASNLVFLVDVSGSMQSSDKLNLVKSSLLLLSRQLRSQDRLSLVVYAGASGVVLEPVAGDQTAKIQNAIEALTAGGSTNGGAGIRLAYRMAEQGFIKDGINRVILATDGDFNVGTVNFEALKDLITEKRKTGISLTTLGVGTGNYNDHLMEQIADVGNGNYAYLDSLTEAQKVLINERSSTLHTIAKDVKIQIEFNPTVVAEYRLIGYENRALKREDFSNDTVDAGEIGAGHTVTAVYEIALAGSSGMRLEPLRYASTRHTDTSNTTGNATELGFLRLRYKAPDSDTSKLLEWPLQKEMIITDLVQTTDRFRFAATVAGFGQLLRGGTYTEDFKYQDVLTLAQGARGKDAFGYRGEFLSLIQLAQSLSQTKVALQK